MIAAAVSVNPVLALSALVVAVRKGSSTAAVGVLEARAVEPVPAVAIVGGGGRIGSVADGSGVISGF